jgi:hypothetical protein
VGSPAPARRRPSGCIAFATSSSGGRRRLTRRLQLPPNSCFQSICGTVLAAGAAAPALAVSAVRCSRAPSRWAV